MTNLLKSEKQNFVFLCEIDVVKKMKSFILENDFQIFLNSQLEFSRKFIKNNGFFFTSRKLLDQSLFICFILIYIELYTSKGSFPRKFCGKFLIVLKEYYKLTALEKVLEIENVKNVEILQEIGHTKFRNNFSCENQGCLKGERVAQRKYFAFIKVLRKKFETL